MIEFTKPAMSKLKTAVGWGEATAPDAVTMAERVEGVIADRERVGGKAIQAAIPLHGYLRAYRTVTCLVPEGQPDATLDEVILRGMPSARDRRWLALDQLIDHYRAELYAYQDEIQAVSDPFDLVGPLVTDMPSSWDADGFVSGLRDLFTRYLTEEEIADGLRLPSDGDARERAARLVLRAVGRRTADFGEGVMGAVIRRIVFQVVSVQWREYLLRVEFLRRQSGALYDWAGLLEQWADNATVLFAACRQTIRINSIRYLLSVEIEIAGE
jgi:hypothetical protein